MKKKLSAKKVSQMNVKELDQATKELEREFVRTHSGHPARRREINGGGPSGSGGDPARGAARR